MSGNSPALTLIVSVITISLAVIVFEVIPMKNIMSLPTKQEEEHLAAILGSGGISTLLMEEIGEKKAPSINPRNSRNSKAKLVHQGFRIEEDLVKLLAREAEQETNFCQ